jgi:hypothetical protein
LNNFANFGQNQFAAAYDFSSACLRNGATPDSDLKQAFATPGTP